MFDIGSNSVRFVAYEGPPRAPIPIYNEKWPISLGEIVRSHGEIDEESMAHLLAGIDRFISLASYMQVGTIKAVATAAIREAKNGGDFIGAAADRGLMVDLLSGEEEAYVAAMGALTCYPDAEGVVADLGGGSLEIARVSNGQITGAMSLPLGTAKLIMLSEPEWQNVAERLKKEVASIGEGADLFMIGGTWRAVAHLHQFVNGHPLQVLSRYRIAPKDIPGLLEDVSNGDLAASIPTVPSQRVSLMPAATRMLGLLNDIIRPKRNISCPLGIREGLLLEELDKKARDGDPLLESARFAGQRLSRGQFDGDRLFAWMQPLFDALDEKDDARLRKAACLLADSAWHIHPDYRSSHALRIGLEGNFLGAGGRERAMIARALWSAYGDSNNSRTILSQLAKRKSLRRADKWGLAIRLGMRIDGGTGMALGDCRLRIDGDRLLLETPENADALRGEAIEHRLQKLARGMGKEAAFADRG